MGKRVSGRRFAGRIFACLGGTGNLREKGQECVIQKDVAKRVCSRASVRPISARLRLGIDGRAANFGVKDSG